MENPTQCAEVGKQEPLQRGMNLIACEVQRADDLIDRLFAKLGPVLKSAQPEEVEQDRPAEESVLMSFLVEQSARLERANNSIESLLNHRIDL